MASITIRNLDEGVKKRLRRQAAENGRSLEAEAREILSRSAHPQHPPAPEPKTGLDLFHGIREVVAKYGGVDLEIPPRTPERLVSVFEDRKPFREEVPVKRRSKRRK